PMSAAGPHGRRGVCLQLLTPQHVEGRPAAHMSPPIAAGRTPLIIRVRSPAGDPVTWDPHMTPPNDNARGRDVIDQILVNLRGQTEELRYSRIVASSYNVHLHPDDFARLEGLVPEIVAQARRALSEELERLNRAIPLEERVRSLVGKPKV